MQANDCPNQVGVRFISSHICKFIVSILFLCLSFLSNRSNGQTFNLGDLQNLALPMQGAKIQTSATKLPNADPRKVNTSGSNKVSSDSLKAKSADKAISSADSASAAYRKKIFGIDIFNNPNITFESSLNIPTPKNYILGAGDELVIDINGYSEEHYTLPVTPDGYIKIAKVGNVFVSGITIEEAKRRIVDRLSKIYIGLKPYGGAPANTTATVSLGSIKTIRVSILGNVVAPGTYSISSLSRVMNALYLAGGPNENGTFREIKVIRDKKLIAQVDLYDLLTTGNLRQNIGLQDQDLIQVGAYKSRVEIVGEVKKPAVFEVLPNENLERIINEYGSGFTAMAYKSLLKVQRITEKESKLIDLSNDLISSFYPKPGDIITVEKVLTNRIENAVTLEGAVFRPGKFSVNDSPTLTKLIKRGEGFREDAFLGRITITRLRDDLTKENISINYNDLTSGKIPDIALRREDIVTIYSVVELMEKYTVRIQGEINLKETAPLTSATDKGSTGVSETPSESPNNDSPIGTFPFIHNMTVEDLIEKAGGLKESAATGRIEVIRRKKNIGKDDPAQINSTIGERFNFSINNNLSLDPNASKFILEPFDEVFVRSSPNYEKQQFVSVEGQITFPGVYGLERKNERISDVIARAGGLNAQAYPKGATLVRKFKISKQEVDRKSEQFSELSDNTQEASVKVKAVKEETSESVGIDLVEALDNPDAPANMLLQDGDIIKIPKEPQTVRMQGEVLYPTSTRYIDGLPFKHYISEAGGFTELSSRKRSYIIYANGSVDRTRKFLGLINIYPKVYPGSEIIVPSLNIRQGATQQVLQTIQTISIGLTSLGTVFALIRAFK
ncbi:MULTISPECIES: SLBB domain-containing protein [unclassified Arcicella]|uniref:polysaccharide biosynthesis/export family protein n=1 Tax=unclassified Arcicella TaxID=2644986 RepID=UPI002867ADED|nr:MULTISPECIES: SLBB domain-containing protein [unclassified Arcicella]MDR6562906.1 protein involved in polysaccharide export with SLBB domain [Arcicella sp. BE51]MDR6812989.1 protein involved in polysaccharide export with SLBB domain [Arcicella sp. BE140]MDR6824303.1 protein involved in polysaccharide export with SLBB domain [Arcicella sp. BE139]